MSYEKERITREEKMAEAIRRMEVMGITETGRQRFLEDGLIPCFITGDHLSGAFYNPVPHDRILRLEKEHNMLIYCIFISFTEFGTLEAYAFVSDYKEEWEGDNLDLKDGYVLTWVENLTYPECSEFGSIAIEKQPSGAIWRVG